MFLNEYGQANSLTNLHGLDTSMNKEKRSG